MFEIQSDTVNALTTRRVGQMISHQLFLSNTWRIAFRHDYIDFVDDAVLCTEETRLILGLDVFVVSAVLRFANFHQNDIDLV